MPRRVRVGLIVAFAALGQEEERAVRLAWNCAAKTAKAWKPAFAHFGLDPVSRDAHGADVLVYLGESSRFGSVAGPAASLLPTVLIKSTVEELLQQPAGCPNRYRMCTGINGIAQALARVAPSAPSVDWRRLPWPRDLTGLLALDEAEASYVTRSVDAFRRAAEQRGISWEERLPAQRQPFSVFLTMHDPVAATLAETALALWPDCTVLAADGMVSTRAPSGLAWPARLIRVRHWSSRSRSTSNRLFRAVLGGKRLPDFDSAGMLFGSLRFLDQAFAAGAQPGGLQDSGRHTGPLGPLRMTASGRPQPERLVIFRGQKMSVLAIH